MGGFMSASFTYALWLQPNGDIACKLQEKIKKLSQKYDTPIFAPHVTLVSSLEASETEMISLTKTLASSLHPVELVLTKAGWQSDYYKSIFIHIQNNGELKWMYKTACQLFDLPDAEPYFPHLSLLYGNIELNEKERILNIIGREFYLRFSVNSIALMRIEEDPEEWKKIETAVF
jgi:2'-5' RNA ligase